MQCVSRNEHQIAFSRNTLAVTSTSSASPSICDGLVLMRRLRVLSLLPCCSLFLLTAGCHAASGASYSRSSMSPDALYVFEVDAYRPPWEFSSLRLVSPSG